jgi:hypothetical protein
MSGLIACISAFFSAFSQHRDLALENLALRQQLAIFKRRHPRPRLRPTDRLFWVWLSKIWAGWREALIVVKPETVIDWHRQAFRFYRTRERKVASEEGRGFFSYFYLLVYFST